MITFTSLLAVIWQDKRQSRLTTNSQRYLRIAERYIIVSTWLLFGLLHVALFVDFIAEQAQHKVDQQNRR